MVGECHGAIEQVLGCTGRHHLAVQEQCVIGGNRLCVTARFVSRRLGDIWISLNFSNLAVVCTCKA